MGTRPLANFRRPSGAKTADPKILPYIDVSRSYANWRDPDGRQSYGYNYRSLGGAWGVGGGNATAQPIVTDATLPEPANLIALMDTANFWMDCSYMHPACGIWTRDLCWDQISRGAQLPGNPDRGKNVLTRAASPQTNDPP